VTYTLLLCPSPLTRAVAWGGLPEALQDHQVAVADPTSDDTRPYAVRWIAACAQTAAALPVGPVTLVAHSGAGPLLPRLGAAIQAAGRVVTAYVFLDASLPRERPGTRLELLAAEDETFAAELRAHLEAGGRFPEWTDAELAEDVPDVAMRAALVAGLRPRALDFFVEPLPAPGDGEPGGWPDAPCGYLRLSEPYAVVARNARARAWPVLEHLGHGHFAAMTDPKGTATMLGDLLAAMRHLSGTT
jgi:hypothetical protein